MARFLLSPPHAVRIALILGCLLPLLQPEALAQYGSPAEAQAAMAAARAAAQAAKNNGGAKPDKPEEKKKEDEKGVKKEGGEEKEDGDEEKKDDGPVKRPDKPSTPPDPRELEAKPDDNGRVRFSFNGQAWADVLQWLANVSSLSLDWRELPSDYLNLTTQRAYTLAEARDLINRHLQARGYTLLLSGEVLSVFKLEELDPSLVPRVTEEDLYDRQPHDVVKLSLELPEGLAPEKAVEDVKQALSPHAKVMPLAATKRLLLIDTVANLRMVSALLNAERLAVEGRESPREFVLTHVNASEVIDILYVVLGLNPSSRPSQMELQMQQKKLEIMSQMTQRGKDVMSLLKKDGPPVYLVYNRQRNSVLANAPPEQMRIIARTIDALDVPAGGDEAGGDALTDAADRVLREYRFKAINPNSVVSTLEEIGDLSPRSELRADGKSKTLFARASESDHEKIAELVERLDGTGMRVEVFWLRRLPADAVAGSIQTLIIEKKKKEKNNNLPFYFNFRNNNNNDAEPDTELRVDADTENNRLLVRGTAQQIDEVRDLLVKLGEPIGDSVDTRRVRVLDAVAPDETRRLLDRIRNAWPSVGNGAPLDLPTEAAPKAEPQEENGENEENEENEENDSPAAEGGEQGGDHPDGDDPPQREREVTTTKPGGRSPFRLLATTEGATPPAEAIDADAEPRVAIEVDGSGRIVISSDDPEALNRLEELVYALAPAPPRFEVFRVENRNPSYVLDNLELYYADELSGADGEQIVDWWGRVRGTGAKKEATRLSNRRQLRFLADDWSSSILVANATPAQLEEIGRLIRAWDRKPLDDRVLARRTATIKVQYSKASVIVAAVKDVYRDMLSRRDKEFDTAEKKATATTRDYLTTIRFRDTAGVDHSTEPTAIGFDGVLSIGSDDQANVVIVSASDEIFDTVVQTVRALDQEARPTTAVRVRQLEGGMTPEALKSALDQALDQSTGGGGSRNDDRRRRNRRRGR